MESETSFVGTRAKFKEVLLQYRLEWNGLDLRSKVEFLLSLQEIQDILRSRSEQKPYCKVSCYFLAINFKSRISTLKSEKHKLRKKLIPLLINFISATWCRIWPLIFQTLNSARLNNQRLKYIRFSPSGYEDWGLKVLEFKARIQFLLRFVFMVWW